TVRANVRDLSMAPLAETIVREARALRERGAQAVIVAAHAGGRCERFDAPEELGSCEADSEIFELARALPRGLVDEIVDGHTQKAVAHEVAGVAIIESRAYGRSFGRVDLEVGPEGVVGRRIHAPRDLCERRPRNPDDCEVGRYEGRPVVRDARVAAAIAPELEAASARLEERLGPRLRGRFERSYRDESPLGNLLADLTLEAVPGADLALVNGGGIRADLPSGPLRFGSVYEAFPFDNRVALLRMRAEAVASLFEDHARRGGGGLSIAGLDVEVRCGPRGPEATLRDRRGQRVEAARVLTLVTSDYVATSGLFEGRRPEITYEDRLLRDAVVEGLRRREGLDPRDFRRPRYRLPGRRPVCR
ncbi:MAG: 5'-nucleotidase C-terminal domain-containing protein, partial [Myxococcota bacterium]